MKKLLIARAALAALIGTPVLAADMAVKAPPAPVAPVYSWAGFYLGVEGGGGWAKSRQTDTTGATTGDYNQSGGLAGGTVGQHCRRCRSRYVLGRHRRLGHLALGLS
jgi:outer membrane immunogenic protein